jgi:polyhydroxybutyrate depolymerase
MARFPLLLAVVLAGLAAALPPSARAGTEHVTFEMDGLEREILFTVPDGLSGPVPLMLALHGVLEDATSMRKRVTRGRLDALADRYGFVVAYPSAWGRVWNLGEGLGADRLVPKRDDLAFLRRAIAEAGKRATIDPDRVFVAGYSMGGMVGLSLACKTPGLVRAVAVVASALPEMLRDDCRAHPPEGVLVINGTADDVVPFAGGPVISGPLARMQLMGWERALSFFTRVNGCTGAAQEKTWDEKSDRTVVTRRGWYNCRRGAVEGYRVEGGGHRWPAGGPILPVTGATTYEIDGAAAVWGFFSRFR